LVFEAWNNKWKIRSKVREINKTLQLLKSTLALAQLPFYFIEKKNIKKNKQKKINSNAY
jgi:hypothetical protein